MSAEKPTKYQEIARAAIAAQVGLTPADEPAERDMDDADWDITYEVLDFCDEAEAERYGR